MIQMYVKDVIHIASDVMVLVMINVLSALLHISWTEYKNFAFQLALINFLEILQHNYAVHVL
jgi:hypothetical protein